MKNINYKYVSKTLISIVLIILITTILAHLSLLRQYENNSLKVMKEIAENDGRFEYKWDVFAVKIDNKNNILDIINNNEFGVERDIYRIIGTNKESGVGYVKNSPVRFFKEQKNYGEIIIFHNRTLEIMNIKLILGAILKGGLLLSIVLVVIYKIYKRIFTI